MKRRAKMKKFLFTGIMTAFLTAALCACTGNESISVEETAEERFFGTDYSRELAVSSVQQVVCGQEYAWVITSVADDAIYQLSYEAQEGLTEQIVWQQPEGSYYMINIAERDGQLYAELENRDTNTIEILKYLAYGGWSQVMSVKPEGDGWGIMGSGFFVDGSGNVYLVNGDTAARFDEAGKQTCVYELSGSVCSFQENEEGVVECVTAGPQKITLYELGENKAEERWTWSDTEALGLVRGIRSSEEGVLCLASGEELLFLDRESGSLRARTDLVKLGVASVVAGNYDAEEGTLWLYSLTGSGAEGLCSNLLSGRDGASGERIELVYGMVGEANASTDSSIWTAITTFNRENEDYYVTIRNYGGWANQDRIYADMAAGNGPDIIDMTYLADDYDVYARSGYLEDLLPYLEESPYQDDVIWNVLDAFEVDGGLYMLVPQFQVRGILVSPDYTAMIEEWNIETFLKLLEENRWEKDIFASRGNPERLLYYLVCGMQEELIDREQGEVFFETETFREILALCREYGEADTSAWASDDGMDNWLYTYFGWGGMFHENILGANIYGLERDCPLYGYPTLSGQVYGVWACMDSCAVYSGSRNKEGAWAFLESLLWDSNQRYPGTANPGFPIRISILKESEEEAKEQRYKLSTGESTNITEAEIQIQEDILLNGELVNSAVLLDSDIWAVIQEETAAYFAGDKSAEETARVIQSRVGIIVSE